MLEKHWRLITEATIRKSSRQTGMSKCVAEKNDEDEDSHL